MTNEQTAYQKGIDDAQALIDTVREVVDATHTGPVFSPAVLTREIAMRLITDGWRRP
jgi:hypothetical protein